MDPHQNRLTLVQRRTCKLRHTQGAVFAYAISVARICDDYQQWPSGWRPTRQVTALPCRLSAVDRSPLWGNIEGTSVKTIEFPTIKSHRISNTLLASAITLYLPVTKWSEQMVLDFGGLYDDPSGFSRWSAVSHLSLRSGFKCRFGNSKNDLFTSLTPSYLWSLFVQPTTTQFLGILTTFNAKTCCVTRSLWQLLRCCCQRLPGCYLIIHKRSRMLRVENSACPSLSLSLLSLKSIFSQHS